MATTTITAEPAVPQLVVTSEFAAPLHLLFRAYTEAQLLAQWLSPRGLTLTADHLHLRHGGTWCCTGPQAGGSTHTFRGVFHGTPPPGRITRTVESSAAPGHVALQTITFTARENTTVVTQHTVYQSVQDRDRVLLYDMAEDINESIDNLEDLLARLAPTSRSGPLASRPSHHRGTRHPAHPAGPLGATVLEQAPAARRSGQDACGPVPSRPPRWSPVRPGNG